MTELIFVDTNVLVSADDLDAGAKRERAREVLRTARIAGTLVVSTQVLQEYFVIATRKLGVDPGQARRKVETLSEMTVVRVDAPLILSAIDLHRLQSISFWNALIVRSVAKAGCSKLATEDLQHGQVIDGVRVVDPVRSRARTERVGPLATFGSGSIGYHSGGGPSWNGWSTRRGRSARRTSGTSNSKWP